jgi:hypothetical protein
MTGMKPVFSLDGDAFVIQNYNEARPFSSFLPGIAGEFGKPMWVFYTNRGQCISSFGVRNKNGAMLEFYPANKAYATAATLGFRTFLRFKGKGKPTFYEPFQRSSPARPQILRIRPHEIEIEETNRALGLRVRVILFNVPGETLPVLARVVQFENIGRKPLEVEILDGLPQIVPYGLSEFLLKQMSRTMEAFAEITHTQEHLPFFKLKVEPSDQPEVQWIEGGFFTFSLLNGRTQRLWVDPENLFGEDTAFKEPLRFLEGNLSAAIQRTESQTGCAFAHARLRLPAHGQQILHSFYGQADAWAKAEALRRRVQRDGAYLVHKREQNRALLRGLTDSFAVHSAVAALDGYSRQSFLDNTLRGGRPYVIGGPEGTQMFHVYSRKHGDMERDYNAFELSPTYFSQGNGNFRDVNQNRRSEAMLFPNVFAGNLETFFNLLQLDGFNPLVIQFERFHLDEDRLAELNWIPRDAKRGGWLEFLTKPFSPGALAERLTALEGSPEKALAHFRSVLLRANKLQDAAHGEGFWIDHWTYNLDLIENFAAVYPDRMRETFIEQRDFSFFDNDHVVQPRHKKYVRRDDGTVRQLHAVVQDPDKAELLRQRKEDPTKVRTRHGRGVIYRTNLLGKVLALLSVKAASLDPFGVGLEMEAEKPGWCDALNGLPGLLGSSVNEAFELRRWIRFLQSHLSGWLPTGATAALPEEVADLLKSVREALALAKHDQFFKTWDTLASLRERFRERTRLGISGSEISVAREDIESFLQTAAGVLDIGLERAYVRGLPVTYFINEVMEYEELPPATVSRDPDEKPKTFVRALKFKQIAVSPFLEGPVHALRVITDPAKARALYKRVRATDLYDSKLGMYRLNVPLTKESYEVGRNKIFSPGWLENESIFLHMHYKFLLETLRSGLAPEFFRDLRSGLVAFQDPVVYGRSIFENSSFIVSSRFPDRRIHGEGFVARLTGATAEWISMVFHMGLGAQPFRWENNELRFQPEPTLASWLFSPKATADFPRDSFAFKFLTRTWIIYHNPARRDTFGTRRLAPLRYRLAYADGQEAIHEGPFLAGRPAHDLRDGRLARLTIDLG